MNTVTTAFPLVEVQEVLEMATPYTEPLVTLVRIFSLESKSSSVSLFCHHMLPGHQGRDSFWMLAPCNLFPGHLKEQSFNSCQHEEKGAADIPTGKLYGASESLGVAGSAEALSSSHCRWRGFGLPCLFYGIRESIEILVRPSFCLLPGHMVLSLVSYFYFIFF